MINPVNGWFEIMRYNDNKAMPIVNLVENMWLVRYPYPAEIMYDRGGKFFGHKIKSSFI